MSYKIEQVSKPFSDYVSLKRDLEIKGGTNKVKLHRTRRAQTGTVGAVALAELAAQTIAKIGKTETALKVISSASDAGLEHAVITAYYLDQDLVPHTAIIADATADMSGATDFDGAVTDFYCWDVETYGVNCFTSSLAVGGGKTLSAGTAGTGYAQIIAAALVATNTSLLAVGTIYARTESDHGDLDGGICTINWWTPIGTKKVGATCTYETVASTDEIVFMYAGFPIQDFYRLNTAKSSIAPTANTHAVFIDNSDNSAIYGVIEEGYESSIHTSYMCPSASVSESFFGRLKGTNSTASLVVAISVQPKDALQAIVFSYTIPAAAQPFEIGPFIQEGLEPLSEVAITIIGNTAVFEAELTMLEALV